MDAGLRGLVTAALIACSLTPVRAAQIAAKVTDEAGKPMADAVVVAVPVDRGAHPTARPRLEIVDQVDKEFVPRVKAVYVGSSVWFPNKDNIHHHVYSFFPAKRFELPLYAGTPGRAVVFDKPGVVVLGCNIHDWMIAYIYVSESPYFAKTNAHGKALLADLPPRVYTVRVWHPQLDGSEDDTHKPIDLTGAHRVWLEWTLKVKLAPRVQRAPAAGTGGSY